MSLTKLTPVEFNVIVKQPKIEEKTNGGLYLSDRDVEKKKFDCNRGTLVAVSELAFNADVWPKDKPRPEPGCEVIWARYAGQFVEEDGEEYRIMKDKDIIAMVGK